MKNRFYEVRDTTLLETHPPRLIEAPSAAAAIRIVASKYEAKIVNASRMAELFRQGVTPETGAA